MVAGEAFRAALRALPFRPGDRIAAVGDSITADRVGWFELLSASAVLTGAPAGELVNLGVSGNTTADVLERFDLLESARPSHVVLMLGTNDARSHGRAVNHRMATVSETERNLRALIDLVVSGLGATVTVITPPAVDQQRVDTYFADAPVRWYAAEVAEAVRKVAPDALDLHSAIQAGPAGMLEADGGASDPVRPAADPHPHRRPSGGCVGETLTTDDVFCFRISSQDEHTYALTRVCGPTYVAGKRLPIFLAAPLPGPARPPVDAGGRADRPHP
jgi:lysophospholipase L1-like esterase